MKQAVLVLMMISVSRASPLQDQSFEDNYLEDEEHFAKKPMNQETIRQKPVHMILPVRQSNPHGNFVTKPNYMVAGLNHQDHHDLHMPSHMVNDIHQGPIQHHYHHGHQPVSSLSSYPIDHPGHIMPVHSHLSSIIAPIVRNIVSNILIRLAHDVSNGMIKQLISGKPHAGYGGYSSPHHYRPHSDYHKSSDSNSYENLDSDSEYFDDSGFINQHFQSEPGSRIVAEASSMEPSDMEDIVGSQQRHDLPPGSTR